MNAPSRKGPFFHGWYVVAATVVGVLFGYSSFVSTVFGLFVKSLQGEFGWSRTAIAFAATLVTGMIVVLAPIAGALVDRFGSRRVLLPSLFAFGVTVCSLSSITGELWQLYVMFTLLAIVGLGTQPVVWSRVVVNWFDRQRGLALGITLSGVGIASIVLPSIVQPLIANFGWRAAYLTQGALVLLVAWPLVYLLVKDRPAELGLTPDGDPLPPGARPASTAAEQPGLPLGQAVRSRPFWQMVLAFIGLGLVSAGFITNIAPLLSDRSFGIAEISALLALKGGAVIVGRVLCGVLVDRFFAPYVAGVFILAPTVGFALLTGADDFGVLALSIVLIGIGLGAEFDLMAYLISRYIGLRVYGKVYGFMYSAFGIGGAVGPIAMAASFDRLGSYSPALWVFAAAAGGAAVLLSLLGAYRFGVSHAARHAVGRTLAPATRTEDLA